ncbi:phosphoribosyltransferase [Afifella pfennigii]|uniref:phosphoribosyltransferase n=1 Tax=Afifella pfennigii TaxID=209897 RepID=UPI000478AFB0|nr:phosphoribosyltransferase family protein [Afifella pfennigii]
MSFHDREEAGERLAEALADYAERRPVVLALPRGGVVVAAGIAQALRAPLDLVLVRKIGVPFQPELAMGALVDGPEPLVVRNEDIIRLAGVTEEVFDAVRDRELEEIRRRRAAYLGERPHPGLKGRVAIVVDDGIATGATTRAALRAVRRQEPRELVLAVPVAPSSSLTELRDEADTIVCLERHEPFYAIGAYYLDFDQVSDEEVKETLARFPLEAAEEAE